MLGTQKNPESSVAGPGVYTGSQTLIFTIPDSGSRILDLGSPISDPWSRIQKQQQKKWWKKIFVLPFFVATNITKFKIILLWTGEEKNLGLYKELQNCAAHGTFSYLSFAQFA